VEFGAKISITVEEWFSMFFIRTVGMQLQRRWKISLFRQKNIKEDMVATQSGIAALIVFLQSYADKTLLLRKDPPLKAQAFGRPQKNPELNACPQAATNADSRRRNELSRDPLELERRKFHWIRSCQLKHRGAETTISMAFIVMCSEEGAEAAAPSFLSLFWVGLLGLYSLQEENSEGYYSLQRPIARCACLRIAASSRLAVRRSTCFS